MSTLHFSKAIREFFFIVIASVAIFETGSHAGNLELLKGDPESFCTKGWYPFGNLCYKGFSFPNALSFAEAEKQCVQLGGHLAAITSLEVQEYVVVQILLALGHRAFIGLQHTEDTSKARWTDDSEFKFQDWDTGEPSRKAPDGKAEHCVEMTFINVLSRLGKWNDISCDDKLPYICQTAKTSAGEKPEKDPRLCPWSIDGSLFRHSCYHLSPHRKSWQDAEKYCTEQYNGHLASITDVSVQKFLQYIVGETTYDEMWIGIRLMPDEISLWSSGWYVGYTNWQDGSTYRKFSSESCGSMMQSDGQWNIRSCEEPLAFICENTTDIPPPRLTASKAGLKCPSDVRDWIDLGGDYCYIIEAKAFVSWYHANFLCMTKGGTLASIHSAAEELVLEQFVPLSHEPVYIGLFRNNRSQANGEFEWADHSAVNYTNWRYGEPNSKEEMCTEVMPSQGMQWNDKKCDTARGFICSVSKVSANNGTHEALDDHKKHTCECLPTTAVVGVVLCVLLVIALGGVVLYNVKPWKKKEKTRQDSGMRKCSVSERPRYRTEERIINEQIYENIV